MAYPRRRRWKMISKCLNNEKHHVGGIFRSCWGNHPWPAFFTGTDWLPCMAPWIPGNQKMAGQNWVPMGTPSFGRVHMTKNPTWTPKMGRLHTCMAPPRAASFSHDWLGLTPQNSNRKILGQNISQHIWIWIWIKTTPDYWPKIISKKVWHNQRVYSHTWRFRHGHNPC